MIVQYLHEWGFESDEVDGCKWLRMGGVAAGNVIISG